MPRIAVSPFTKYVTFQYNNSRDESYWIRTGKDDHDKVGEIISWASHSTLNSTWWPDAYANELRGSGRNRERKPCRLWQLQQALPQEDRRPSHVSVVPVQVRDGFSEVTNGN